MVIRSLLQNPVVGLRGGAVPLKGGGADVRGGVLGIYVEAHSKSSLILILLLCLSLLNSSFLCTISN